MIVFGIDGRSQRRVLTTVVGSAEVERRAFIGTDSASKQFLSQFTPAVRFYVCKVRVDDIISIWGKSIVWWTNAEEATLFLLNANPLLCIRIGVSVQKTFAVARKEYPQ